MLGLGSGLSLPQFAHLQSGAHTPRGWFEVSERGTYLTSVRREDEDAEALWVWEALDVLWQAVGREWLSLGWGLFARMRHRDQPTLPGAGFGWTMGSGPALL